MYPYNDPVAFVPLLTPTSTSQFSEMHSMEHSVKYRSTRSGLHPAPFSLLTFISQVFQPFGPLGFWYKSNQQETLPESAAFYNEPIKEKTKGTLSLHSIREIRGGIQLSGQIAVSPAPGPPPPVRGCSCLHCLLIVQSQYKWLKLWEIVSPHLERKHS